MNKKVKKIIFFVLYCFIISFGLWITFHETFALWKIGVGNGISLPPILFNGFKSRGGLFLTTFRYARDNWLIFPSLVMFLVYPILGINKYTIIGPGWLILIANAFLGYYLIRKIIDNKNSYAPKAILILLIFVSLPALYWGGWMSYLISHYTTFFLVLVSLILLIMFFLNNSIINLILLFISLLFIIFIGSITDAWFIAVFVVPATLFLFISIIKKDNHKKAILPTISIILGFIIAKTKIFGIIKILPNSPYPFVTSVNEFLININFFINHMLTLFSINEAFKINQIFGFIYLIIFLYLLSISFYLLFKNHDMLTVPQKVTIYISSLSIITISGAYLLSSIYPLIGGSGRYIINIYYFIILLIVFSLFKYNKNIIIFYIFILWLTLSVGLSIYEGRNYILNNHLFRKNNKNLITLINFLETHKLHYGYIISNNGNAINGVTAMSDFKVRALPLAITNKYIHMAPNLYSSFWYQEEYIEKHKKFFIIIRNNNININLVKKEFGNSLKTYNINKEKVILCENNFCSKRMFIILSGKKM